MNRALVIWNVGLTLLVGYLLFNSFSTTRSASPAASIDKNNVVNGPFRMAYFEMDSVAANTEMVKELKAEMSKREDAIKSELDRLGKNMQQKLSFYQQQANSGSLTQEQSDAASLEMQNLDNNLKNRQQTLESEYSDYVLRRQNEIKARIEEFLKEYNKNTAYSYIISYEPGLFYYKDSAHNITRELIDGLNRKFKSAKK
ncbi:MAG: OmpH family outer membrane protein [Bacteroidetes bacterium]|nr:OmpH family outer membrane protein [Bacteroidota bacterium]